MSKGVNKVIIVGHLGNDPEIKYMPSGGAVTNISVATTDSWKDKTTGEKVEKTEWHKVVFFNRLAEIVGEYLKKGSQVYIEGALRTRKWQDQGGEDKYTTEIVASEMQMLGGRGGSDSQQQSNPAASRPDTRNGDKPTPPPMPETFSGDSHDGFDDDIPF